MGLIGTLDILDDFQQHQQKQQQQLPHANLGIDSLPIAATNTSLNTAKQTQQEGNTEPGQTDDDEDFARQLQAGMQGLLAELQTSPQAKQEFESLVKSMSEATEPAATAAAATGIDTTAAPNTSSAPSSDSQFQDTISKTIARMQESSSAAKMNIGADASEDEFLAEMMRQLTAAGGGAAGEGGGGGLGSLPGVGRSNDEGSGEFTEMLEGVMSQLMNKEILYEPMKELAQKYPQYIAKTKSTSTEEENRRYEEQGVVAAKITAVFEHPNYSDDDTKQKEDVLELMQQV